MGVFDITLSSEYYLLSTSWQLSRQQLHDIARRAIDYTFVDDVTQSLLRTQFDERYSISQ
jgi:adenosine deaminase